MAKHRDYVEVAPIELTEAEQVKFDAQVAQADLDTSFCTCGKRRMWHFGLGGMGLCHGAQVDVGDANTNGGFVPRVV